MSVDQMSVDQMSIDQMSIGQMFFNQKMTKPTMNRKDILKTHNTCFFYIPSALIPWLSCSPKVVLL